MLIKTKLMILVLGIIFCMGTLSMVISINAMRQQAKAELKTTENTFLTHKKGQSSKGISDINSNLSISSESARGITTDISDVNASASRLSQISDKVKIPKI